MIVTDLNDRERARYAKVLREGARNLQEMAAALLDHDDDKAAAYYMLAMPCGEAMSELTQVIVKAVRVTVPDTAEKAADKPSTT